MEFVTFEIAKKLKEKGFREKCFATYDKDGMLGYNYYQTNIVRAFSFEECMGVHDSNDNCIDVPTISQVLKWLREEKEIMFEVPITLTDDGIWKFTFRIQTKEFYDRSNYEWDTYEKSALAGIKHVLENLI